MNKPDEADDARKGFPTKGEIKAHPGQGDYDDEHEAAERRADRDDDERQEDEVPEPVRRDHDQ